MSSQYPHDHEVADESHIEHTVYPLKESTMIESSALDDMMNDLSLTNVDNAPYQHQHVIDLPLMDGTTSTPALDPRTTQIRHIPMTALTMDEIRRRRQGVNRLMTAKQFKEEYSRVACEIATKLEFSRKNVDKLAQPEPLTASNSSSSTITPQNPISTTIPPPVPLPIDDVLVASPFHVIEHAINRELAQYSALLQPQSQTLPTSGRELPDFSNLPRFGATIPNIQDLEAPLEHIKRHRFTQLLEQPLPTGQNAITINHIKALEDSLSETPRVPIDDDQVLIKVCVFDAFTQMLMVECIVTDDMPLTALRDVIGTQCPLDKADLFDIEKQLPRHVEYERPQDIHVENIMVENALYEDLKLALEKGYECTIWLKDKNLPGGGITKTLTYEDLHDMEYFHHKQGLDMRFLNIIDMSPPDGPMGSKLGKTAKAAAKKAAALRKSTKASLESAQQIDDETNKNITAPFNGLIEELIEPNEFEHYLQQTSAKINSSNGFALPFSRPGDVDPFQDHIYVRNEIDISGETTMETTMQLPIDYCDYLLAEEKEKMGRGDISPSNLHAYHALRRYLNGKRNWLGKWTVIGHQFSDSTQHQPFLAHYNDNLIPSRNSCETINFLRTVDSSLDVPFKYGQHALGWIPKTLQLPHPSSFFFINNTFYDDRRSPLSISLSDHIIKYSLQQHSTYDIHVLPHHHLAGENTSTTLFTEQVTLAVAQNDAHPNPSDPPFTAPEQIPGDVAQQRHLHNGVGIFQQFRAESTTFADLPFRIGEQYLFQHQGNCQHVVMFTEMRIRGTQDYDDKRMYPLVVYRSVPLCHNYQKQVVPTHYLTKSRASVKAVQQLRQQTNLNPKSVVKGKKAERVVNMALLQDMVDFEDMSDEEDEFGNKKKKPRFLRNVNKRKKEKEKQMLENQEDEIMMKSSKFKAVPKLKKNTRNHLDDIDFSTEESDNNIGDNDLNSQEINTSDLSDNGNDLENDESLSKSEFDDDEPDNQYPQNTRKMKDYIRTLSSTAQYPGTVLVTSNGRTKIVSDVINVPLSTQDMYTAQLNKTPLDSRLLQDVSPATYDPTIERLDQCLSCDGPAMFLVYGDRLMPFNPSPLCQYCYDLIHYTEENQAEIPDWDNWYTEHNTASGQYTLNDLTAFNNLIEKRPNYEDFDTFRIFPLQKEYTLPQQVMKVKLKRQMCRSDVLRFKPELYQKVQDIKQKYKDHHHQLLHEYIAAPRHATVIAAQKQIVETQKHHDETIKHYTRVKKEVPGTNDLLKMQNVAELASVHDFFGF